METKGDIQTPNSISPDGRRLAYGVFKAEFTRSEIWTVPIEGDRDHPRLGRAEPFLQTPADLDTPAFSPDGRWLDYYSDESGAEEIYVRPFPGPGGQYQVSSGGGSRPIWAHDGRQLFFLDSQSRITVADCGVTGVPDEEAGEVPKAFVVLKPGASAAADELAGFVADRVAGYKQIRQWAFMASIPRTPSGKILRRMLTEKIRP